MAPPPKKGGSCGVIAIVLVLIGVLVVTGLGIGAYVAWKEDQGNPQADGGALPSDPYGGHDPQSPEGMQALRQYLERIGQAQGGSSQSASQPSPDSRPGQGRSATPVRSDGMTFPDERQAMDDYARDPSRVNAERVATVRFRYAVDLFENASRTGAAEPALAALAYAESACAIRPNDADYQFFYARVLLFAAGETAYPVLLAENALNEAVRIRSDFPAARLLLGRLLTDQKRYFAALGHLEFVLVRHPELASEPCLETMARCYLGDGVEERGTKFLSALAPRLSVSKPFALVVLARLARAVGDPAAAGRLAEAERLAPETLKPQIRVLREEWRQ